MSEQIVGASPVAPIAPTETKSRGVYIASSIYAGVVVGGPFVAGWLMGENYKTFGKPDLARKAKWLGAIAMVAIIAIGYLVKQNLRLGIVVDAIAAATFARLQKDDVAEYLKNGGQKRRWWPAVCIVFVSLLMTLLAVNIFFLTVGQKTIDAANTLKYKAQITQDLATKDFAAGITDADKLIGLIPHDQVSDLSQAYELRGALKIHTADYAGAQADFAQALSLTPSEKSIYLGIAQAYESQNKTQDAIDNIEKALALDPQNLQEPSNADILDTELQVYNDFPQSPELEQKFVAINTKIIALSPSNFNGYFNRGLNYVNLSKWDLALADLTKALELKPDYDNAHIVRGDVEAGTGQHDAACFDFSKVTVKPFDPVYASAYTSLQAYCK